MNNENRSKKNPEELVTEYIAKELTQRKKSTMEVLASIATLLAALDTLFGAAKAYDAASDAKDIQMQINQRQIMINENGRIGNLWMKGNPVTCQSIDIENFSLWK